VKSDDKSLKDKKGTLTDADISSQRVTRRSLLASLGIGAGVAAATVIGATKPAQARRVCDRDPGDNCFDVSDNDPGDPAQDPYDSR
jgi:hypothetical protein